MIPVFSVSQFIEQVNGIIAGIYMVEGELSHYTVSQGKWIFFDLKDGVSCLSCFSTLFTIRVPLEEGMRVRVTGYPKIVEKSGRFSFTVQKIELVGDGSLKRAFELLKAKLSSEGLFESQRKRLLPLLPSKIGVIASRDSAALGDFLRIINNRWAGMEVILRHVNVQGQQSVPDIVQAFKEFNARSGSVDVLVLVRGGGSPEDLAAFNNEEVARAVYASVVPVLVGVGHEQDVTLCDLVADVRASTPSNAAELVSPERQEFLRQLCLQMTNMAGVLENVVSKNIYKVERNFGFMVSQLDTPLRKAKELAEQFTRKLDSLRMVARERHQFVLAAERLFINSDPKRLLKRGYSITRNTRGNLIKSVKQVDKGENLVIELGDGLIRTISL